MWPFANSSCRNFEKCWKFLWHWDTHFRQGKASIWVSVIKMVKKGVVEMGKCIRKYPGSDAGDRNGPFTRVATYIENNIEMNSWKMDLGNKWKVLIGGWCWWLWVELSPLSNLLIFQKNICWHSNIDFISPAQESWLVMAGTQSTPWIVDSCQFDLVQNSGKVLLFKIGRGMGEFDGVRKTFRGK